MRPFDCVIVAATTALGNLIRWLREKVALPPRGNSPQREKEQKNYKANELIVIYAPTTPNTEQCPLLITSVHLYIILDNLEEITSNSGSSSLIYFYPFSFTLPQFHIFVQPFRSSVDSTNQIRPINQSDVIITTIPETYLSYSKITIMFALYLITLIKLTRAQLNPCKYKYLCSFVYLTRNPG